MKTLLQDKAVYLLICFFASARHVLLLLRLGAVVTATNRLLDSSFGLEVVKVLSKEHHQITRPLPLFT